MSLVPEKAIWRMMTIAIRRRKGLDESHRVDISSF